MLSIENLKAKIEDKEILKGLNLNIKPGAPGFMFKFKPFSISLSSIFAFKFSIDNINQHSLLN